MSIWSQKSASIQPRTSSFSDLVNCGRTLLGNGDKPVARPARRILCSARGVKDPSRAVADCAIASAGLARANRSLEGSFSAGSTPIFASKYAFCSIFRDLQNYLAKFSKVFKILQNLKSAIFLKNHHLFCKNPENFAKSRRAASPPKLLANHGERRRRRSC